MAESAVFCSRKCRLKRRLGESVSVNKRDEFSTRRRLCGKGKREKETASCSVAKTALAAWPKRSCKIQCRSSWANDVAENIIDRSASSWPAQQRICARPDDRSRQTLSSAFCSGGTQGLAIGEHEVRRAPNRRATRAPVARSARSMANDVVRLCVEEADAGHRVRRWL